MGGGGGAGAAERLAEGAASGRPAASIMARATGWEGIRTATVGKPALTASGTRPLRGRIMVSGPGPISLRQPYRLSGQLPYQRFPFAEGSDMDNQRIVLGPALGGKDTGRRRTVQSIRRQAINGLGGDSHQLAFPQQPAAWAIPSASLPSSSVCFLSSILVPDFPE